jgi:NAD(P)-dependent dehydrogenase (short-subunit alcohol dehydrogenase family)
MGLLADRAIVVTGAGGGLGRAYAVAAAAEGAAVVVNDVDEGAASAVAGAIADGGGRAVAHAGSVADWAAAGAAIERCSQAFGRIDGLINNAGISRVGDPWREETGDRARAIVEVNLLGTIYCGVHALRAMVAQRSGSILNVTSGALLGLLEHSLYGASKGGVAALTWGWAVDAAPYGVRVNAISPLARTAMSEVWVNRDAAHMEEPPPESVAPLAVFLLSDRAADVNGQVVRLDAGGLSIMRPPAFPEPLALSDRSLDGVESAFGELRRDLQPVGFSRLDLRDVGTSRAVR